MYTNWFCCFCCFVYRRLSVKVASTFCCPPAERTIIMLFVSGQILFVMNGKHTVVFLYLLTLTSAAIDRSISRLRTNFSRLVENVNYYSLNWHTFQKYVNSNTCEKRKVHVKRVNYDTFRNQHNHFLENFRIIRNVFGRLRKSLGIVLSSSKSWHSQDKNITPLSQKTLSGKFSDSRINGYSRLTLSQKVLLFSDVKLQIILPTSCFPFRAMSHW